MNPRIASVILAVTLEGTLPVLAKAAEPKPIVSVGNDGKLHYNADERGNRIPDFSRCGYMGGGVRLPDVPVRKTISPVKGNGDDTARIQQAIDELAQRKQDQAGFRGALLLTRGTYRVEGTLNVRASGIVLRGEGQGPDGTVLIATGTERRTLVSVGGSDKVSEIEGSRRRITDTYVPWGTLSFNVESTEGLSKGDAIVVFRPGTANWIHELGMDSIPTKAGRKTNQWQAEEYDLYFERIITSVEGTKVTLDAPIVNAMEDTYGGGFIYRYTDTGRIARVGVEHLRLVSEYKKGKENEDEDHAINGVVVHSSTDAWARNVTTLHFERSVRASRTAKFVTVQDCASLKPVSLNTGGRRYPFALMGQYCLFQRCYTKDARHAQITGGRTVGPNVFLDCMNENTHSDIGPHGNWAVGFLWDNLKATPNQEGKHGAMNAQDRAWCGVGQGWAGGQMVFWNCHAKSITVQQPPTAQNYAIGCTGEIGKGMLASRWRTAGHYESHGTHVVPRSLYLKQLEDRLGRKGVENVTTEAQRKGTIYSSLKEDLGE